MDNAGSQLHGSDATTDHFEFVASAMVGHYIEATRPLNHFDFAASAMVSRSRGSMRNIASNSSMRGAEREQLFSPIAWTTEGPLPSVRAYGGDIHIRKKKIIYIYTYIYIYIHIYTEV